MLKTIVDPRLREQTVSVPSELLANRDIWGKLETLFRHPACAVHAIRGNCEVEVDNISLTLRVGIRLCIGGHNFQALLQELVHVSEDLRCEMRKIADLVRGSLVLELVRQIPDTHEAWTL